MRFSRTAWPVLGAAGLLLAVVSGCGSTGSSVGAPGKGVAGSAGSAGTTNTGPNLGGHLGGAAASSSDGGSASSGGDVEECAGTLIEAQRIPLDMYVMLDVSGSMLADTAVAGTTKWQAVSSALTAFVSDPTSDGIGVGLQVFPIANKAAPTSCTTDTQCGAFGPCYNRACLPFPSGGFQTCVTDDDCQFTNQECVVYGVCANDETLVCEPDTMPTCGAALGDCVVPPTFCLKAADCSSATYAAPAAPIAALPGARDGVVKVIAASTPQDGAQTPTGPALAGAIQEAKVWATAHPDHQVVAVLATDGQPSMKATSDNLCAQATEADVQAVVDLAAAGLVGEPKVSTFVIGVLSPDDMASSAPTVLNNIARSGGTSRVFIVNTQGDVQQQFRDALNKIRASGLACELALPAAEPGKALDYGTLNVTFDSGAGAADLVSVPDASKCEEAGGGWYYDVPPAEGTPTRIVACPSTCADFQKTDMGSVQLKLGCKTRSVVK